MAYTKYSLTPADNNAAPPNGAPEGMLPSGVNDTMRDMMSQIRDVGDGIRGGTYTMTAPVITGGSITGVALSGNTLTNPVITGGSINNTPIGASTANTGAFTTLASNGATTFTANTASTSTTTGTAVITGGLGVSGRINAANFDGIVGANTAAAGNFTTLGATGVATFSAGSVSAPAITTTGDTNTGIYFPAADTIAFAEGGAEVARFDSSGNLGIGTSSPSEKLQINNGKLRFLETAQRQYNIGIVTGTSDLAFTDATFSVERLRIDGNGGLILAGSTAQKATGTTWSNPSDVRLKDNIQDYAKGLPELMQVNVKTWEYNGKGGTVKGTKGLGVVADEIKEVLPDTVDSYKAKLNHDDEEDTDIKKFDATEITWLMLKSIQELKATVDAQAARIAALESVGA
jgi:hypothetical protein